MLLVILVTFGIAGCSPEDTPDTPVPPTEIPRVNFYLDAPSAILTAGDTVDVAIRFDATVTPVAAAQAYLNFDPAVLRVIDEVGSPTNAITPGDLFSNADWQILQNNVDNSNGRVNFAGGKKPTTGTDANENLVFAMLKFMALKPVSQTSVDFNTPGSSDFRQTKAGSGFRNVTGKLDSLTLSINP